MNKLFALAIAMAVLPPLLPASDTPDRQDAIKRIEQAVSKTNIFELPSFRMIASLQIDNNGKPLEGTYQLLWNGPDQWKEEISFPGYNEVEVGGKGTITIKRSTGVIPFDIFHVHAALGYGFGVPGGGHGDLASLTQFRPTSDDMLKKTRSQKRHGDKLTCFEFENDRKQPSEVCLYDDSGLVARDTPYGDSDFRSVADKIFPRFLSYELDHKVVAKVNVSELTTPVQIAPNSFAPPTGVSSQPGCMNPAPTRIVKKVIPQYPQGARQNHIEGTVGVDVVIGVDGVPRNIQAVASPSPELAKASMAAIKEWRYEPASCAGTAVAVETVLSVNYSLH